MKRQSYAAVPKGHGLRDRTCSCVMGMFQKEARGWFQKVPRREGQTLRQLPLPPPVEMRVTLLSDLGPGTMPSPAG